MAHYFKFGLRILSLFYTENPELCITYTLQKPIDATIYPIKQEKLCRAKPNKNREQEALVRGRRSLLIKPVKTHKPSAPTVTAREKRSHRGSMSIRYLEYKAKERRSKLGHQSLAITCECHELARAPWSLSLQSCNTHQPIADHINVA
jgi:hypothetical protein